MKYVAIKGIQAGKEYYIVMVKLKELETLFPEKEEETQPEKRAQRKLNIKRIPAIKKYIVENLNSYVFSALAASVDGTVKFSSFSDNFPENGILEIADNATFLINDGQHRKCAIAEALKECPELGSESIPVVLFKDQGLKRSQQMFTDLNKHAVKTSNSLSELYDTKDLIAGATRQLLKKNKFIGKYTDKEKDNLSMNSAMLFTFHTFCRANKRMVGLVNPPSIDTGRIIEYWGLVVDNIRQWNDLETGDLSKRRLRSEFLVCQSVVIEAFGQVGNTFYRQPEMDGGIMETLREIDWSRGAEIWKKRCVKERERMVKSDEAVYLTANAIKMQLGLPLNEEEIQKEKKLRRR